MFRLWDARLGAIALLGLALTGCSSDDSNGPPVDPPSGDAIVLTVGDTTPILTLTPRQLQREHHLAVSAASEVAVFLQGVQGGAGLRAFIDSVDVSTPIGTYLDDDRTLLENRTDRIVVPAGKTLNIVVYRGTSDSLANVRYRLFVYRVNRAPERGPATITLGQVRTDEDFETSADIDEFSLAGHEGKEVVGYLAAVGPADPYNFVLQFADKAVGGAALEGGVNAPPAGVPLEDNATDNFKVPAAGSYVVRVTSSTIRHLYYSFLIRQVNRAPETSPAVVGTSAVISEALDYTGDIDEFTVHGTAGQLVNLFLESATTVPLVHELFTYGEGVRVARAFLGFGAFNAATGAITIPASGNIGVRVSSAHQFESLGRGAYRIRVMLINPGPETAAPTLTGSDSIIGETIGQWADRDEFSLSWPVTSRANLFLRRSDAQSGPLRLDILKPNGESVQSLTIYYDTAKGSGRFSLPAGNYRVRVIGDDGSATPGPFTGPYSAYVYRISEGPESAPATLALGAVVNDAIDPLGDRDTFDLDIPVGELFQVRFTVPSPAGAGLFVALGEGPIYPGGPAFWLYAGGVSMPSTAEAGDDRRLSVSSYYDTDIYRGAYTMRVEATSLAPESNPSTIGLGSTVGETLTPGDVDQYDLSGAPNAEYALLMRNGLTYACAEVLAPDSRTQLGSTFSQQQDIGSGIIRLGPTGHARIRVWAPNICPGEAAYKTAMPGTADYVLNVLAVNHAPEIASVSFSIGDTVRNETLSHPADIDEFQFSGSAGQHVVASLRTVPPAFPNGVVVMDIHGPGGFFVAVLAASAGTGWVSAPFTLTATGTYTVKVTTETSRDGLGAYEFTVRP